MDKTRRKRPDGAGTAQARKGQRKRRRMPVYEYRCRACGAVEEHLQPMGSDAPGPCAACGGELRKRFSRVGVRYQGWGFQSTDALVPDDRPRKDFRALRDRAERIADGD